MSVAERKLDDSVLPLASSLQLCFLCLKLGSHLASDTTLQVLVNLRNEVPIKLGSAHRAIHAGPLHFFLTLKAQDVIAGCLNGLDAQFEADWALKILAQCTSDDRF